MSDNGLAALKTVNSLSPCPCGSSLPHGLAYMPKRNADSFEIHRLRQDGITCIWDCVDATPFAGPVYRVPPPISQEATP